MELNEKLGAGIAAVRTFIRRHRTLIISVVVMFVLMIASNVLKSGVKSDLDARNKTLSDIKNQITMEENKGHKVVEVVNTPDHGLSTKRWQEDDEFMLGWIEPAFTWGNLDEYKQHRQFYVERLGANDPFLTNFLVERDAQYAFQDNYGTQVDMGTNINMHMSSFKTYVVAIDEQTGVYSYMAMITVSSTNGSGQVGTSNTTIVLLYDITKDRQVQNFKYTTVTI